MSEEQDAPEYRGPKNRLTVPEGYLICPLGDGNIHPDSHQADPCFHCKYVYHDRCFYTTGHRCVSNGLVPERFGYGLRPSPGEPPFWVNLHVPEAKL